MIEDESEHTATLLCAQVWCENEVECAVKS